MTDVDYSHIPAIVDALLDEGLPPSARRVRQRLGSGSYETIQLHINQHLRTIGRLEDAPEDEDVADGDVVIQPLGGAGYLLPEPNPDAVARHLASLRSESARRLTDGLVMSLTGVLHELALALRTTPGISRNDLAIPHPDGSMDVISRGIPDWLAWASRVHRSLSHAPTGGTPHDPAPAA